MEIEYYNPELDRIEKAKFETIKSANLFKKAIENHEYYTLE